MGVDCIEADDAGMLATAVAEIAKAMAATV